MRQVLIRQGKAAVEEVPAPQVEAGTVLVAVSHSCISIGTEMSGLTHSGTPLWKRALRDPQKVRKAIELAATRGLSHTTHVVRGELNAGAPTGYSAAGTVVAIGAGVTAFRTGDRVACAGAQCAHHAEYICVPENLVVAVPEGLTFGPASTVTLGAIALQGVRRSQPTLGETMVVVGLGILGQLTVQLLKANGCRVIGLDVVVERVRQAETLGLDYGLLPDDSAADGKVLQLTDGVGADGVIVTAASPDERLLSEAFRLCRRKGRVVLVGDIPIRIQRDDIYRKEIDFFISTSYGPGRYDQRYEERGLDYPVGYVRWTENRNMAEYLRLLSEGLVDVEPLVEAVYPLEQAGVAYGDLQGAESKPMMVLLEYPRNDLSTPPARRVENPKVAASPHLDNRIRIAVIGAGGFAKGTHLPNLKSLANRFSLRAVMSRSGHNAQAVARQYEAAYATTDIEEVLADGEVDAVLVATRHHLHADLTLRALQAGKHVLVEKPLAMNASELAEIEAFFSSRELSPVLLTGFNRRFSPHLRGVFELLARRAGPFIANYRMNAGQLPADHWVHGPQGGGRNISEACHIYDLFTAFADSGIGSVEARAIRPATAHYRRDDNFVATLCFEDGSLATLTYTALGHKDHPKERMELYVDGVVAELDDYRHIRFAGLAGRNSQSSMPEKGQRQELVAFAEAVTGNGDWPIPLWQQLQAMRVAFEVERSIGSRLD